MDWADALPHLPFRLAVTDRKGRVLLLSAEIAGVRVGKSFLKLADAEDIMTLGRAAKRVLKDGTARKIAPITGTDQAQLSVQLVPWSTEGAEMPDHLLVMVRDAAPAGAKHTPTPAPAVRRIRKTPAPVASRSSAPQPVALGMVATEHLDSETPQTTLDRTAVPLPPVAPSQELVVVAAGGALPLARAVETVLADRLKTRAIPVARFVDVLGQRANGETGAVAIDQVIDAGTRVLFIGHSPYADDTRSHSFREGSGGGSSGWAIGGGLVRRAAVWPGEPPGANPGELVADLQFEMMEVVRRAMPVRRQGRLVPIPDGLRQAAAFLEQPAAMEMNGDLQTQARHHQLVIAIARFIQEGLDPLIGSTAP